jgi:hypothetical protein
MGKRNEPINSLSVFCGIAARYGTKKKVLFT